MRTNIQGLILVACCCLAAGCVATRSHDRSARSLFPGLAEHSEEELQSLYAARVNLPPAPRVAVFWLDEPTGLPDGERARLLGNVQRAIDHPPLTAISVLPSTRMVARTESRVVDLDALRSAAARFQSDVLILILTRTDVYNDWNPLSVSYLALVPLFFVPGDSLETYVTAEACAVDVRSGVFLGCTQGNGDATRHFVTPLGKEARQRELVITATEAALRSLPGPLSDVVVTRLEGSADTYETD